MKKLTLSILFIIPLLTFSQLSDFTNSTDGWVADKFTATPGATSLNLTTVANTGNLSNPTLQNTSLSINADVTKYVGITLKNNDTSGPTELRLTYINASAVSQTIGGINITAGDTAYKTYWIDFTHAKWTGTIADVKMQFGFSYVLPDPQVSIDIDKVEFVAVLPSSLKQTFNFATDGDTEGFAPTPGKGILTGPSGGILTFAPEKTQNFARFDQQLHHVNADDNKYMHITLKNNSGGNDKLYILIVGGGAVDQIISVSDTAVKTYTFDFTAVSEWSGTQKKFTLRVGSSVDGKTADLGSVEFSSIVINDSPTFSSESFDAVSFTMSPNPAQNSVKIHTLNTISKVLIYNIAGSKVLESNGNQKSIDVSPLNSGIYFVKISDSNNNLSTQKLIIQ